MSALQTDTLEANNNANPTEALEAEASSPTHQFDAIAESTTEVTDTDAEAATETVDQTTKVIAPEATFAESVNQSSAIEPQTSLPVSTTSDTEKTISTTEIAPTLSVKTEIIENVARQEPQSVNHQETEIAEITISEHDKTEPFTVTITEENHSIKDSAVIEAQQTLATNPVTVTKAPVQPFVDLPFNTDWIMVFVFLLTTAVLVITNRREIKKAAQFASQPVMPMQNPTVDIEFEKAKLVAENRQKWILSLREEVAKFVSATNAIWDLHKIKDGCEDILTDMNDPQFVMKELYHWSCTYNKAVQDTEQLYTKIHLLINPNEEKAQTLCKLLDRTMVAIEAKKSPSKSNDDIIAVTQEIIKDEWERVKTFS